MFECKQARSDLLRDSADERRTLDRLRDVVARRRELEHMLGVHLPDLRRGESLFAECDSYDFESIRHDGLRSVRRDEARLQAKLFGGTKFDRLRRYACADRLYLVVAAGVMQPHEVPAAWGLLVAAGDGLELVRRPERLDSGDSARLALLHAVATAGTRFCNRAFGVEPDEIQRQREGVVPE